MEQPQSTSVARRFEDLTNLFYLMVALPLVAFIWVYLNLQRLQPWGYFADPSLQVWLNAALLGLALVLGILAFVQYRKRFTGLEPQEEQSPAGNLHSGSFSTYKDDSRNGDSPNRDSRRINPQGDGRSLSPQVLRKFEIFKSASLQKYMLLTASTVLVIVGYYLSAAEFYAAFYGIMIIIFSVHRPTPDRFMSDMRLKKEERQALRTVLHEGRRQPQQEEK